MSQEIVLNGRYRLVGQLGSGGMAVVYKAEDLSLGRIVAIKVLRDSFNGDGTFLSRFQQEARSAAGLAHPNIVTVHDFGHDSGRYYIVMEWVDGEDLKTLIRAHAPFAVDRAVDLGIQICDGLGYAHRAGLAHCDVKPQNVIVTTDGRAKVTDFGIARALANYKPGDTTDVVWGSPQYFSPEQAAGEVPTPASDVYSVGVVLYEMLAGRLPFHGQNHQALALMHMRENPPPMSTYNPAVPETMERIVQKVLAKEPSARYRTADQLGQILSTYRAQGYGSTSAGPAVGPGATPREALPGRPAAPPAPRMTNRQLPTVIEAPEAEDESLDWMAVFLGFVTFVAVAGLITLWAFVFYLLSQRATL